MLRLDNMKFENLNQDKNPIYSDWILLSNKASFFRQQQVIQTSSNFINKVETVIENKIKPFKPG